MLEVLFDYTFFDTFGCLFIFAIVLNIWLLLSYKNPDFFSGLSELYRIFSKMTEFMGVGGVFLSILFVYMLHGRPHLNVRKQWHMRYKCTPLIDAKGHLFEFSPSQLAFYLWTSVTSSSYRRTRHS